MAHALYGRRLHLDAFVIMGGVLIALDTIAGTLAALDLKMNRPNEIFFAISLVAGLPVYLLHMHPSRRNAAGLWLLFLTRWLTGCVAAPSPNLCHPLVWPEGMLLVASLLLLEISKFRSRSL